MAAISSVNWECVGGHPLRGRDGEGGGPRRVVFLSQAGLCQCLGQSKPRAPIGALFFPHQNSQSLIQQIGSASSARYCRYTAL